MTAKIISFPRRKPLELAEMPVHWTDTKRSLYRHWTSDGYMSHQEAFDHIDGALRIEQAAEAAGEDPTLAIARAARAAVARLPLRS